MGIIHTEKSRFGRLKTVLPGLDAALEEHGMDGWLLYDLHARNTAASGLVELPDLTRRWFVWLPRGGEPVAVTHGIEQGPWEHWPWSRRRYVGWRELDEVLAETLAGARRVAMEVSPGDAVPAMDLVPAGVRELVQKTGVEVVPSGELIARFYSAWSEEGLASHRRAAALLAKTADAAFRHVAERVKAGEPPREDEVRQWVLERLREGGAGVGADSIVAIGVNAADPHYAPTEGGAPIKEGDVLLLDLWSKEAEDAIYADQTWMAYLGAQVPARAAELFAAIRDGRDAGVALLRRRWEAGEPVQGYEVDDAVRGVIRERGWGDAFIHRTGHSIDTDTHGMGPNIDNLETHETRRLIPGVGFSIEPGIYLEGEIGLRTEIDVYMGPDGPEVTTPEPQREIRALLDGGG